MLTRTKVYIAAWILFVISLVASSGTLISDGVYFSHQLDQHRGVSTYGFVSMAFFILGYFTNVVMVATLLIRNSTRPPLGWRLLLIGCVLNNAAIGACFFGNYLKKPWYWLWLLAFVVAAWSLLRMPPDRAAKPQKTRSSKKPSAGDDSVPVLLWAWLACTFFWIGVMTISFFHPPNAVAATRAPKPVMQLTSYVNDVAHAMAPADAARIDAILFRFEKETSNQIAVVVFPEAPADDVEGFTIQAAEMWKVGRQGRDNGAILFLFLKQRIARIEVGYGLEGALPDAAARQILDQQLSASVARGNVSEGIDHTVAAMMERVRSEYSGGRTPGTVRTTMARLRSVFTVAAPQAWPFVRDTTVDQRLGISFFASLIGFGIGDGIANAVRMLLNLFRLGNNLVRRRPLSHGMIPIQLDSFIDTVKLIAIATVPLAGVVVLIAGGGAFGGAGASIRWSGPVQTGQQSQASPIPPAS